MTFVSYAQNFEDVMLWRALKHIEHGFYVDIGANHPTNDSVSKAFYDRGWRGVHVEPVAEFAQLLREARPDEDVIEKAVGAETGELTLHVLPGSGLSSLVEDSARASSALLGYEHVDIKVPVVTLDELLAPYAGRDIHWLKIDVEGAELDVLRGWNARRDRPWIMVVEATVPNTPEECHQAWEPILLAADYRFVYFDGLSRFYVAEERGELASSFRAPPNYFDEFVRADLVAAMAERDEHARQLGEVRQQAAVTEKLSIERHHLLEQAAGDMQRLLAEKDRLSLDLRIAAEERDRALADVKALTARLDEARGELESCQADVAALTAQRDAMLSSTSWQLTAPLRGLRRIVSRR